MLVDEVIENKEIARQYKELLRISYQRLTASDKKLIRLAFDTSVDAHKNQRRKSGEAYVFHPIEVAKIVADEIGLDATSIAAALLHDVLEDTDYNVDQIESLFGKTVTKIVVGLTKISNLKKDKYDSLQAENFRKMLLTLNDDIRVIIIKIADRLHNMKTLNSLVKDKREKIAAETLFIYAPLAHRIGLYNIKSELEDLGLKHTDLRKYNQIKNKIEKSRTKQDLYIKKFSSLVQKTLNKENFKYSINGRSKSIYSIFNKMENQSIPFELIYDKFAIRIVYSAERVDEKFIAWKIYSIITDHFVPNPTRLRDWITAPKSTGYEALHVTVSGPENQWVEVQIRSDRMHEIAEKGYAAHHKYKIENKNDIGIEDWLDRLKELLKENSVNAVDFVDDFKLSLYSEEIFVFTPNGDLLSIPKGSTALDFAFSIHTEIGIKTRGVRINQKLVPLSKVLKSGDQVEIITSEATKPNANWLDFVVTSRARSKIKSSLNEEKKKIEEDGKEILRRKLKHLKIILTDKVITLMLRFFKINASSDLYYQVGSGTLDNKKIRQFSSDYNNKFISFFKKRLKYNSSYISKNIKINDYDKLVFGKDQQSLSYMIASCCNPIPGDSVFGFITINEGIKVHKKKCSNALSMQSKFAYRIINAKWINSSTDIFTAILRITGIDNIGLVNELTRVISSNMNVDIFKLNFETEDGLFKGNVGVRVRNKTILNKMVKNLQKMKGIEKVTRE
ncbi:MAG: guanosine-3',5'-bis(diphosphate) 3'-pyrophosphohydrolase [Candidatus Marivariicella framensis]|jgi:guanosine-3',5'-bis(diphosphate) 3'-pyrophosphohydrolase|tara:strand:+ start:788 stop:2983 length:2196 start_codon:yes stop_codon:yes gene_type:complete